jgi:hypothetical protein
MDLTTTLAIVATGVALIVTPIWLVLGYRGIRSLTDIRDTLRRPPRDRQS